MCRRAGQSEGGAFVRCPLHIDRQEHGVAETARLTAALITALRGSGYSRFAIELSPIIAQDVEAAGRRNGVQGIEDFLTGSVTFTFCNLHEEGGVHQRLGAA
jgi:hypothetical protein